MSRIDLLRPWLTPAGILAVSALVGWLLRGVLFRWLEKVFAATETRIDDVILQAVRNHLPFWVTLAGLAAAASAAPLGDRAAGLIQKGSVALFFVSLTWCASRLLSGVIEAYGAELRTSPATTHLAIKLAQIAVVGMGLLLLLANLGISIAPLLTALGVSSLAVALALQDTLSNLFAGIYLLASEMVRVGDYIKLDTGQEGVVEEVGWRTATLRDPGNNHILIPNTKLSQAMVTNYDQPDPEVAVPIALGAAYGSDLDRVERLALEVAADVQESVPGAATGFKPLVRFDRLGDAAVQFAVILRARAYPERGLLIHEFIKRLHARFQTEGLAFPVWARVLEVKGGRS